MLLTIIIIVFGAFAIASAFMEKPPYEGQVVYSPSPSEAKPFMYNGQRYDRDELSRMGLDEHAKHAILNYR